MTDPAGFATAGSMPVPDPTKLTTDAVNAATTQWRRDLANVREIIETRLDGMDRAILLRLAEINAAPVTFRREIDHLTDVSRERFDGVDRQFTAEREYITRLIANVSDVADQKFTAVNTRFDERDTRTAQAADESRISLDAALAAAKEAVSEQNKANTLAIGKSELATQKQIDALSTLMTTSASALDEKITDVKSRLDRSEGRSSGFSSGWGILVGAFGLIAAAASVIAILKP